MPSNYSTDLRIELIQNGEQSGTWGTTTNNNLGTLIEDAISGLATVTISSTNQALTALNGAADQARCAAISLTGASAPFNLFLPPVTKLYVIKNNTAYSASVYCGQSITPPNNIVAAGAGMDVHAGKSAIIRSGPRPSDPSFYDVVDQLNYVSDSFEIGTTLTVNGASTLTGATTFGSTVTLNANPTLALQAATKQYVDSAASASFPVGGIIMWSGSVVSIPAGWALCDGTSGTPDLRDRFIVGAGNTYAVAATGGSKDAIVVGHTHSASSSVSDPGHTHTYLGTVGPSGTGESSRLSVPFTRTTNIAYTGISVSTSISPSGSSGTDANLPPYYALAYIMKT